MFRCFFSYLSRLPRVPLVASSPYPPRLHARPASFSPSRARTCSPHRPLAILQSRLRLAGVRVCPVARAAGTPFWPLHTQIREELSRDGRTIPARRYGSPSPPGPSAATPARIWLHSCLQRWPAHLISLEFAFPCGHRPHFDRQPPTLGLPASAGWFCWRCREAGELRSRGLSNRHPRLLAI